MAPFWERAKTALDWLQHVYWIGGLLISLGLGRATMAWLARHVNLARDWEMAIWLIFSGAFLLLLTFFGKSISKKRAKIIQPTEKTGTAQQLEAIEQVYRTYDNQLLAEVETLLRVAANKYKPGEERDGFFIRTLASATILSFFEGAWYNIFASQIKALERLNKEVLTTEDLLPYFHENADRRPQYTFEAWIGFLKQQVLLRQDGHNISITIRGKEFLKYLVEYGRTWADKPML